MSKAFTKGDASDEPLIVPSRAPLPPGVTNYVTPRGLGRLKREQATLARDKARAEAAARDGNEDAARDASVLATRLGELEIRLASAELVEPSTEEPCEVRFGMTVTVARESGEVQRYRIVGVDEANAAAGDVAFVSPLARALLGRRVGEVTLLCTPRGEEELEVVAIEPDPA